MRYILTRDQPTVMEDALKVFDELYMALKFHATYSKSSAMLCK